MQDTARLPAFPSGTNRWIHTCGFVVRRDAVPDEETYNSRIKNHACFIKQGAA